MITVKASLINATETVRRIWDNYEIIGEVLKAKGIKFVVAAGTRHGVRYVHIQEYYKRKSMQDWKPGRHGITIPLKNLINNGEQMITPYADLLKLVEKTAERAAEMPLHDKNNEIVIERRIDIYEEDNDK